MLLNIELSIMFVLVFSESLSAFALQSFLWRITPNFEIFCHGKKTQIE